MKRFLILIIAVCSFVSLFAKDIIHENSDPQREQIESKRVAFLSTEIGITPEEATAFWPVYNAYHKKLRAIYGDTRKALRSISKLNSSENQPKSEIEALIKRFVSNKEKEANLLKEYFNNLSTILPAEKIAKLIIAEEEFRRQMIYMWRSNRDKEKDSKKK